MPFTVLHLWRPATILLQKQLGLYWRDLEVTVMILTRNLNTFQGILEPKVGNKKLILDKTVKIIWSQILQKISLTWPLKIIKKLLLKSTKNMKLSTIFDRFQGLNNSSYHIFRTTFNSQFALSFNFGFGHKIPEALET